MKRIRKLIIIIIAIYAIVTFTKQQKTLNLYRAQETRIAEQIQEAKDYKEELTISKENANSFEYIEQVAREKLNMYYPNERIYVDNSK